MDQTNNKSVVYRKDYREPTFWVKKVDLAFVIGQAGTAVKSRIEFYRNTNRNMQTLELDGTELELKSIHMDDRLLTDDEYEVQGEKLLIHQCPDTFVLTVENRIRPDANTQLEGLYRSGDFLLTQCEAEGFRKITYYPDRPDVLAPFDVTVIADKNKYPVLLSNGNPVNSGELKDGRHYIKWHDPHPKPSYLFALVAGDLHYVESDYTTTDSRQVSLKIYTEPQNIDACQFAMDSLKRAMQWDEQRFGLAYDLDQYNIVVTDDFNMGAMENKSLNIFNSKYVLAKPETATDDDFVAVEAVIGHEYFHNWTGNRITCQDWFQLSLKEGLTVFRDQEFTSDLHSRTVKRIQDVRMLRSHQFAEDAGPMSHPVRPDSYLEINNFYTLTVYEKGSEVVRMYHTLLGEDGFQKGMKLYVERHDGAAATCDDFKLAMADANQVDLQQFGLWYSQNGTPQIAVQENYDEVQETYTLQVEQQPPMNYSGDEAWQPMHIPMKLSLYLPDGQPHAIDDQGAIQTVVELRERKHTFTFDKVPKQPVASLFQEFSAPVQVKRAVSTAELSLLMAHDRDLFNRWDAAQTMMLDVIKQRYNALLKNLDYKCPETLLVAFTELLVNEEIDSAFIAEAISLPDIKTLMNQLQNIDVAKLHEARKWLRAELAEHCRVEFLSVYNQNYTDDAYAFSAQQVAQRSLKNACLVYLMALQDDELNALCLQQYQKADNYTDRILALMLLVHHEVDGYEALMQAFYEEFAKVPLVINKWFAIQATVIGEETLSKVRGLMEHPAFTMKNPNLVRALIGAFCAGNPVCFHAQDGSGYTFLADQVIALNKLNPQIASRMVSLFNDWKRFTPEAQQLMRESLQRIRDIRKLSPDVQEIVDKALESA
ncbi:aminopeptidase N [Marinicella sp. W31]|uniref:aminopeptidase N n=1 Tax=Marinicella sp. W31 TaxID=3023713 RepID=UPI0037584BE2